MPDPVTAPLPFRLGWRLQVLSPLAAALTLAAGLAELARLFDGIASGTGNRDWTAIADLLRDCALRMQPQDRDAQEPDGSDGVPREHERSG